MPRLYNLNSHKQLRRQLRNNPTPAERKLWRYLKGRQFHGLLFHRQHGIGRYIVDFYCPQIRMAIEVDGPVHDKLDVRQYDEIRSKFLEESCYLRVVRLTNEEVMNDVKGVLKKLEKCCHYPQRRKCASPSLIKEGDGGGSNQQLAILSDLGLLA